MSMVTVGAVYFLEHAVLSQELALFALSIKSELKQVVEQRIYE